jgi:hypothetical protein
MKSLSYVEAPVTKSRFGELRFPLLFVYLSILEKFLFPLTCKPVVDQHHYMHVRMHCCG